MVWTFVLDFLKSKIVSVVLIAALAIGGWYHQYKTNDLEEDLAISQNTVAVLANEYEKAVDTAQHNADVIALNDEKYNETLYIVRTKYEVDLRRLRDINKILEGTRHVNEEDDVNISNVMRSTLDAIRVLREDGEL